MKIVQEENLQHVEHQLEQRYQLDPMSCLFFSFLAAPPALAYGFTVNLCSEFHSSTSLYDFSPISIKKNPANSAGFLLFTTIN